MNFYRAFKISDRFGIAFTQENPDADFFPDPLR